MVDDFMVCVDRLIASACFQSGNEAGGVGGGRGVEGQRALEVGYGDRPAQVDGGREEGGSSNKLYQKSKSEKEEGGRGGELIECRICQEEGKESDMEAPCSCNGTLKFAHRKCIQRWCNKKGDITCEICNQVYAPNYSIPPNRANSDCMAIDIRQSWGPQINLRDSHYLAIATSEQQLLHVEYEDYTMENNNTIACCHSVALILLLLILIPHALMVTWDSGMVEDASAILNGCTGCESEKGEGFSSCKMAQKMSYLPSVSLLQLAGFVLPFYLIARSCTTSIQSRRRQQT